LAITCGVRRGGSTGTYALTQEKAAKFLAHKRGTSIGVNVCRNSKKRKELAKAWYDTPRADILT